MQPATWRSPWPLTSERVTTVTVSVVAAAAWLLGGIGDDRAKTHEDSVHRPRRGHRQPWGIFRERGLLGQQSVEDRDGPVVPALLVQLLAGPHDDLFDSDRSARRAGLRSSGPLLQARQALSGEPPPVLVALAADAHFGADP